MAAMKKQLKGTWAELKTVTFKKMGKKMKSYQCELEVVEEKLPWS